MIVEMWLVFAILGATVLLFASDRLRLDVVALLALLALALTGILTPAEALAGFADPVVLMIAGLFVVGDGLFQTGVARAIGRLPARVARNSELGLLAAIMVMVALLSGFISSTGTVAIMLPVVVGLAWERGIPPSRLLIPLSVASLLGGMLTLIGTAPNIVVSNQLVAMGREPFGFFAFTPVGVVMLGVRRRIHAPGRATAAPRSTEPHRRRTQPGHDLGARARRGVPPGGPPVPGAGRAGLEVGRPQLGRSGAADPLWGHRRGSAGAG
jgi:Na+/H+ antiporter NhaD/arsenite permease-like protein